MTCRALPAAHLDLIGHWRIAASRERVWAALAEPETWPRWWPCVLAVRTLRTAGADGVGGIRRVEWKTPLAGRRVIELEAMEAMPLRRLRHRTRGSFEGEDIWLLRGAGARTELTCVWRVELPHRLAQAFTPFVAALLRWNHACVMQAGEAGLGRLLGHDGLE